MNIEEARKVIKNIKLEGCKECVFDNDTGCINENGEDCQEIAIETLLTAYEKEKEKNKELRDRVDYLSKISGLLSTDTIIEEE